MTKPLLIVCGVRCTWWDTIDKVAKTPDRGDGIRIPCCPHCGSVLYQFEPDRWWKNVDGHEARHEPGYRKLIEWMQGKCFPSMTAAKAAYAAEPGQ